MRGMATITWHISRTCGAATAGRDARHVPRVRHIRSLTSPVPSRLPRERADDGAPVQSDRTTLGGRRYEERENGGARIGGAGGGGWGGERTDHADDETRATRPAAGSSRPRDGQEGRHARHARGSPR